MNTSTAHVGVAGRSGRLPHLGVLRFAGLDAATFLQGQVSNDTQLLTTGQPLLAAYSSPQGRVVAVLHLMPHSTGILALLPREIVLPTLERLRKFVMRAKVTIEDVSDQFSVAGHYGHAPTTAGLTMPEGDRDYVERFGIAVARIAHSDRFWLVGRHDDVLAHGDAPADIDLSGIEHGWRLADVRAGLPQVYAATREMFVAQMLNLDLLAGISFTKGCYTGQEIIARTQHLGRIKRRMVRLLLPAGTWAIGQALHLTDGRHGRLTELAPVDAHFEALAVLTLEAADSAPEVDSDAVTTTLVDATPLPLPYGHTADVDLKGRADAPPRPA